MSCILAQADCAGHPGAEGLAHAANHEVNRGLAPGGLPLAQCRLEVLCQQKGEDSAEVGTLAQDHGIRQPDIEQHAADAGVGADGADQVRQARAALLCRG